MKNNLSNFHLLEAVGRGRYFQIMGLNLNKFEFVPFEVSEAQLQAGENLKEETQHEKC